MLTEKDIDEQIQADYAKFYNKNYDGTLPDNLIDLFKIALYKVPPQTHQLHTGKLKKMCALKPHDLTVLELGIVLNVIMGASFDVLYPSLEEALDAHTVYEQLQKDYNKAVDVLNKQLQSKKATLMKVANLGPSSKNNFRIAK